MSCPLPIARRTSGQRQISELEMACDREDADSLDDYAAASSTPCLSG